MKTTVKTLVFCAVAALFSSTAFAADTMLADRHVARGQKCAACHVEKKPAKAVPTKVCQKCHGDFDKMKARTAAKSPNPHYTHMGEQPCEECHKGHAKPVNMCAKCHTIKMNVR